MNARPRAWMQQARNDLAAAELMRDNKFHAQACYLASQAAEKGLKGLILELGLQPPRTHVLTQLLNMLQTSSVDTTELDALALNALTRMGATSRYPLEDTPPGDLFDRQDAERAIATAAAVLAATDRLNQPSG